jgi:hypothetical protein
MSLANATEVPTLAKPGRAWKAYGKQRVKSCSERADSLGRRKPKVESEIYGNIGPHSTVGHDAVIAGSTGRDLAGARGGIDDVAQSGDSRLVASARIANPLRQCQWTSATERRWYLGRRDRGVRPRHRIRRGCFERGEGPGRRRTSGASAARRVAPGPKGRSSAACSWYARHGRELMGCKSPVGGSIENY